MTDSLATRAADVLGRPYSIGDLALRNRIAMSPMTRGFSPGGVPGTDVAAYYARRATGGTGLIITEGTYVGHASAGSSDRVPRFHGADALAGWSAVADAVHRAGAKIVPQLWHVGMDRSTGAPPVPEAPRIGPSGIALDGAVEGHTMSLDDIDDVIAAFAAAASDAEANGFDGVELHGAHGYLIDQFLWSRTNRRTDAYGGDPASRARFATEIVAACRKSVSPGFPIIVRLSQWKLGNYDAKIAETARELEAILSPLAEAGADAFHCSTRRYWVAEFAGSDLNLAGWAKSLTGKTAISVGSVGLDKDYATMLEGQDSAVSGIDKLLRRLASDEFDLVAVGRAMLADPEWADKILSGRTEQLVPFSVAALSTLH